MFIALPLALALACARPAPPPPPAEEARVRVTVLEEGQGEARVEDGSLVLMHYTLTVDGEVMDSSHARGQPLSFHQGEHEVIRGWEEGVAGMRVGERRALVVPPEKGYGSRGAGNIPPDATLHFEVQLVDTRPLRHPPASPAWVPADALVTEPGGLQWADLTPCDGARAPSPGAELALDYSVFLPDGTRLGSSLTGYDPARVSLGDGELPPAVEAALLTMSPGCARQLRLPPELGGGRLGDVDLPATQVVFIELALVGVR